MLPNTRLPHNPTLRVLSYNRLDLRLNNINLYSLLFVLILIIIVIIIELLSHS